MERDPLSAGPFRLAVTDHPPGLVLERHAHPDACLHIVLAGIYQESTVRGASGHASPTVLFKPAGEPHWNHFSEGARTLRIECDPGRRFRAPVLGPVSSRDPGLQDVASRLFRELALRDDQTPLSAEGLCLELLARLARTQAAPNRGAGREVARRAAALLEERYREPVRFVEIARELDVNRSFLARSFRTHRACTLGEYLRRLRVEHVQRALVRTDLGLAEIAAAAGFADQSHCTRVFKRLVGVTPGRFRQG